MAGIGGRVATQDLSCPSLTTCLTVPRFASWVSGSAVGLCLDSGHDPSFQPHQVMVKVSGRFCVEVQLAPLLQTHLAELVDGSSLKWLLEILQRDGLLQTARGMDRSLP